MSDWKVKPGSPASRHFGWDKHPTLGKPKPPVYVYVVAQTDSDVVKVGIATNVKRRMNNLTSSNPHPLKVMFESGPFERTVAEAIEAKAHEALKHFAMSGEWFRCSVGDATRAVTAAITEAGQG